MEGHTSGVYGYTELWLNVVGDTSLVFDVMLCRDAHLALAMIPYETGTSTIEVVIGGWENSKSAIRKQVNVRTIARCTYNRLFQYLKIHVGQRTLTVLRHFISLLGLVEQFYNTKYQLYVSLNPTSNLMCADV